MVELFPFQPIGAPVRRRSGRFWIVVAYLLLLVWALLLLAPLVWMFLCALTPNENLQQTPPRIRLGQLTWENFDLMHERSHELFCYWFVNSLYLSLGIMIGSTFLSALAGYCFARLNFPGRNVLFALMLATMMVPYEAIVLPLFVTVNNILRLADTHWAIILPQLAAPFGIFLCRQYLKTFPSDLEDSARIDGCNELGIFLRVILPISKPVLVLLAIFTFLHSWKNFFWPLIVLRSESKFVLEVGLAYIQEMSRMNNGVIMASAATVAVPMILFFLFFQGQIQKGLAIGTMKR